MIVVTFLSLASQATIVVHTTVYTCSNQSCEFCRLLGGQMIVKRFTLGKFPEALTRWHHNEMNVFSFIVFNILNCDRLPFVNLILLFKRRYNVSGQLSRVGSTPPAPTGAHRDIRLSDPTRIRLPLCPGPPDDSFRPREILDFLHHWRASTWPFIPQISGSVPPPHNHAGCFRGTSSVQSYAPSQASEWVISRMA